MDEKLMLLLEGMSPQEATQFVIDHLSLDNVETVLYYAQRQAKSMCNTLGSGGWSADEISKLVELSACPEEEHEYILVDGYDHPKSIATIGILIDEIPDIPWNRQLVDDYYHNRFDDSEKEEN